MPAALVSLALVLLAHRGRACIPLGADEEAQLPSRTCNIRYAVYGRLLAAAAPGEAPVSIPGSDDEFLAPAPDYWAPGSSRRRSDDFEVIQVLRQPETSDIQPGDFMQVRHGGPLTSCGSSLLSGGEYILFGDSAVLEVQAQNDNIEDPSLQQVQDLAAICEDAESGLGPGLAPSIAPGAGTSGAADIAAGMHAHLGLQTPLLSAIVGAAMWLVAAG